MEQLRLLLAIVAALLSAVFFGVWWVKGRQRSSKGRSAALIYSLLLICSAALLLMRAQEPQVDSPRIETTRRDTNAPKQVPDSTAGTGSSQADSSAEQRKSEQTAMDIAAKSSEVSSSATTTSPARNREVVSQTAPRRERYIGPPLLELPKRKREKPREPEEVVEDVVLDAFDVIELFFDKFGSPAPSPVRANGQPTGSIEFQPGTAQLSSRSLIYLRSLAPELRNQYRQGQLEILAQSGDTARSPAQRYLLTQSRAESVRDVLIAEGFPPNRIIPKGSEAAGVTRVKFVHRPN